MIHLDRYIDPEEFAVRIKETLLARFSIERPKAVTGPGRSGAIAAVYASHLLSIPFIPFGNNIPEKLSPLLVIDTAKLTGATIRKAAKKYGKNNPILVVLYDEPPIVKFWYEREKI